jgi:membrane protein required for colicin V production
MNYLDIALVIPMVYGVIRGFSKGIVNEITSLAAIIVGVYLALNFSVYFEELLTDIISKISSDFAKNEKKAFIPIISFALIFLFSIISVKAIGSIIDKITNVLALGIISKIIGALFGFFKLCVILSCVIYFEKTINIIPKKIIKNSVVYSPIESVVDKLAPSIKKHEGVIKELEKKANKAKKEIEKKANSVKKNTKKEVPKKEVKKIKNKIEEEL